MSEGRREGLTPERLEERRQQRHESRTHQTYKAFLKQVAEDGRLSEQDAELAAVSVLCALEQRLMPDESKHLEAQLPQKLRELLIRCERHPGRPPTKFGRQEFLEMVAEDMGTDSGSAEAAVRTVFGVLMQRVTEGEISDVIHQLPQEFHDLWLMRT